MLKKKIPETDWVSISIWFQNPDLKPIAKLDEKKNNLKEIKLLELSTSIPQFQDDLTHLKLKPEFMICIDSTNYFKSK